MRWFVDVGTIGKPDKQSHCVEAESWQKALQAVRAIRADVGSMGGFSIELLEDGCRAVDPLARLRYELRRAPDDAPLTGAPPKGSADGPVSLRPPAPAPLPAPPVSQLSLRVLSQRQQERSASAPITFRERAYLVPPGTRDEDAGDQLAALLRQIRDEIAHAPPGKLVQLAAFDVAFEGKPTVRPLATLTWKDWREPFVVVLPRRAHATPAQSFRVASAVAPAAAVPQDGIAPHAPPASAPISSDTKPASGFAAEPPTKRDAAAQLAALAASTAHEVPPSVRPMSASRPSGTGRTARPPAPSWPAPTPSAPPAAPPASVAPPPVAAVATPGPTVPGPIAFAPEPAAPLAAPIAAPPPPAASLPAPVMAAPLPAPAPAVVPAAPVVASALGGAPPGSTAAPSPQVKGPRRPRGNHDDLLADLFEAASELHYMTDAVNAAEFCAILSHEKLEADASVVHIYNINRREFVSAAGRGHGTAELVGVHHNEADPMLSSAMRRRRPLVLTGGEIATGSRARLAPVGDIKSMLIAPVMQSGRFLGAIELMLTGEGTKFSESDSHALGYIADQLAEFLGARGVAADSERAQPVARSHR